DLIDAVILGLVEGITEYLPVSSTGHLIITNALLGLNDTPESKQAADTFAVVVQGGAILAVLGLYWPSIVRMLKGLAGRDAGGRRLLINLIVAFLPAAILGLLLDDLIEAHLFSPIPVLVALALGGIWMIWLDRFRTRRQESHPGEKTELELDELDWKRALGIGLLQCVAMWPGTSRSMMTIAGGTLLGLKPRDAAQFSFLLGLPTLTGACVLKLGKDLYEAHTDDRPNFIEVLGWMPVLVGVAVATVSAVLAIKWLVNFLNKHGLAPFGWYRLLLTAVMGGLIAAGVVSF
ncbi:MAG: undecaprenyl-diphosphate phosphatase, partial [Planctomycetota bacterium]